MSNARELAELGGSYGTGGFVGMKNRIINGDMQISQRGTTFSSGTGTLTYTLDRWTVASAGAAVSVAAAQDSVAPYVSYMGITGASGNTLVGIRQRIEWLNTKDLAGQNVTVSFYCYNATSNATSATVQLDFPTAKDNYTSTTSTATQSINLSNTSTVQTFTFAVPDAGANGIQLTVYLNNLTSGVLVFRSVQLEKGSTATSFDYRSYGTELALCQRYYVKTFPVGTTPAQNAGYDGALSFVSQAAQLWDAMWRFPVNMRIAPTTVTTYSPNAASSNWSTNSDSPAASIPNNGSTGLVIRATTPAAAGRSYAIQASASAEL